MYDDEYLDEYALEVECERVYLEERGEAEALEAALDGKGVHDESRD